MLSRIPAYLRLLLILISLNSYSAFAQLDIWPHLKHLQLSFNKDVTDSLNIITTNIARAERLIKAAAETGDREILVQAFSDLFASCQVMYGIYDRSSRSRRRELPSSLPEELRKIDDLKHMAEANMNKSLVIKKEAEKTENIKELIALYYVAYDLEMLALLNKGRVLRVMQDYPVIYEYVWDHDMTVMDGLHIRIIREVIGEEETYDPEKEEYDLKDTQGVSFVVQIAAHTSEIAGNDLRSIYSGNLEIKMIHEENWYRYYLGPWNTFEEAEKVFNMVNLRNAFISGYHNGKRIGVAEARRRQAQNNR